jgi:uncharacterized phage-associated protein
MLPLLVKPAKVYIAMTTPTFKQDIAVEAFLYVANRLGRKDYHKIFKVLYFADREHLVKYGSPVTGDTYIKMKKGPVPSKLYDMVKSVKSGGEYRYTNTYGKVCSCPQAFAVSGFMVSPLRGADMDFLSQTNVEELEASIEAYGKLSHSELTERSHGMAWQEAEENRPISMESILREAGEDEDCIDYITYFFKGQRA